VSVASKPHAEPERPKGAVDYDEYISPEDDPEFDRFTGDPPGRERERFSREPFPSPGPLRPQILHLLGEGRRGRGRALRRRQIAWRLGRSGEWQVVERALRALQRKGLIAVDDCGGWRRVPKSAREIPVSSRQFKSREATAYASARRGVAFLAAGRIAEARAEFQLAVTLLTPQSATRTEAA
jgi:hypothetical protein